ncbi:MAG: 3-methyl-2-oxobutanoate hydroxymethyltransferase [candidate division KSB1 bacterium]|nr:3-methyl-2-oxobutanoate hydroxymethyltransferase [candidate division KSB1 bacterium]
MAEICAAKGRRKLVMLTCYDYSFARLLNGRVDMLLVGDSLGNVILGYPRTTHVTLQDMIRHTAAVRRGAPDTFLIADLPAGSYDDPETAIQSAHLLVEAGADAVKPEGRPEIVSALTSAGFSVMGHLGYLPQSQESFRVVGRDESEAEQVLAAALSMQTAGAFSVVLECLPSQPAERITSRLTIPTIGIGAGPHCDGQVLVLYDLLGLFTDFQPKFVRRYADLASIITEAVDRFILDVKQGNFPNKKEEYR